MKKYDDKNTTYKNNFRLVLLLLIILCSSCINNNANKSNGYLLQLKSSEDLIKFKKFISKFKILPLPFVANTGYYEPDSSLSVPLDMDSDSIFIGYIGPGVTVGMLPDTSKFYAIIYCTAAACYMPVLAVYSKNGTLIDKKEISKGCGAGVGYICSEVLTIKSLNDITVVYIQESFDVDNFGNEVKGTNKKKKDTYKYSIEKAGVIRVSVFQSD